ncbi:hypothetical protein Aperf_G00000103362 [Anoplocephala perfoliata]
MLKVGRYFKRCASSLRINLIKEDKPFEDEEGRARSSKLIGGPELQDWHITVRFHQDYPRAECSSQHEKVEEVVEEAEREEMDDVNRKDGEKDPSVGSLSISSPNKKHSFTQWQQEELEKSYQQEQYPSREEWGKIARRINLTRHQVRVWYSNRRVRDRRNGVPVYKRKRKSTLEAEVKPSQNVPFISQVGEEVPNSQSNSTEPNSINQPSDNSPVGALP